MAGLDELASALTRAARSVRAHGATGAAAEAGREFLGKLKDNTPVLSGALQNSERVDGVSGGGSSATAVISTHLPLYASFREYGGTITVKHARVLTDGHSFFGTSVTQTGSAYMARTDAWAGGALARVAGDYVLRILKESGL